MSLRNTLLWLISFGFILMNAPVFAQPADVADEDEAGPVPPRLSWLDGEVYFEREGSDSAQDAVVNLPLAPRDLLRTGPRGSFEIQFGPKAFARGWSNTRLELELRERNRLRFDLLEGDLALDIRRDLAESAVEIRLGGLVASIRRAGYYRLGTDSGKSVIRVHRGGRAILELADGGRVEVSTGEECAVGPERPESYALGPAPAADPWDDWNIARTDYLVQSESERHVPPDLYGTKELDRYGTWSRAPEYGPVWTPHAVPPGWVPYSTGFWILDPYYGWTWVDSQPWGWAPFHYGRWVRVHGRWCWAPGPVIVRPVYAPALVVFTSSSSGSILFSLNGPPRAWVALGWGEPCIPWWGHSAFRRPWWGGWGGPRVVNHVVIQKNTVVHVHHLRSFEHAHVHRAVVKAREDHFPRDRYERARFDRPGNPALREFDKEASRQPREMRLPSDRSRFSAERPAEGPRSQESEVRRPIRGFEQGQAVRPPNTEAGHDSRRPARPEIRQEPGPARETGAEPGRRGYKPGEVRTPVTEAGRGPLTLPRPDLPQETSPRGAVRTDRTSPETRSFPANPTSDVSSPQNRREARGSTRGYEERTEFRTTPSEVTRDTRHRATPLMRRESEPGSEVPAARMRNGSEAVPRRSPEAVFPGGGRDARRYLQRGEGPAAAQPPADSSIGERRGVEARPSGPVRTPFSGTAPPAGSPPREKIPWRQQVTN